MIFYPKTYKIRPASDNRDWLIQKGRQALSHPIPHITDAPAPLSEGGPHDYYLFFGEQFSPFSSL